MGQAHDGRALKTGHKDLEDSIRLRLAIDHARSQTHRIESIEGGIVIGRPPLGNHENRAISCDGAIHRAPSFVPAHEDRHDHLWKQHDIPNGNDRDCRPGCDTEGSEAAGTDVPAPVTIGWSA